MPQLPAAQSLRLAESGQPGATLFNAYNYLTQLSTLYAHAGQHDPRPVDKALWHELCDLTLTDLGDVYNVWDAALRVDRSKAPVNAQADAELGVKVKRACRRAQVVIDRVNVWTPLTRTTRLIQLCERRWQKILEDIHAQQPVIAPKLESPINHSKNRHSRLTGLLEKTKQERERVDRAFIPAPKDSEGF